MLHGQLKLGVQEFSGLDFVILNKYICIYIHIYTYMYIHSPVLPHSISDLIDHLAFITA